MLCARPLLVALALVPAGCGAQVFACTDPSECPGGTCEPSGWCSFPDAACDSGQRYGGHAPSSFAGQCVELPAGTSGDASTSSSTGALTIATLESSGTTSTTGASETTTLSSDTTSTGVASSSESGGMAPDLPPQEPECIVESFDDGTIDGFEQWNDGLAVDMSDGTLRVTLSPRSAYFGIGSPTMGFDERDLRITVLGVPNQATSTQIMLTVADDTGALLLIHEYGVLAVRYDDGVQWMNLVEVDPWEHTVWRVWTHDGMIGFDRALPGGEPENLWTEAAPFDLAAASAYLTVGTWETATDPGDAQLDDLSECPFE